MNGNTNGFFELIPKKVEDKASKKKKIKPPKFKKGGWKHWMYKKLKSWKTRNSIEDFHFAGVTNILIAHQRDPQAMFFSKRVGKGTLKKLEKLAGKDGVFVLIDAGDKTYLRFSVKSYLKLVKIDKMIISFRLRADVDGIETIDVFDREDVIDNINSLARYINHHRQGIDGVYEIQSLCYCCTTYDFNIRIVVMKTDGSVETYKGDMNDFMKAYDIYPF